MNQMAAIHIFVVVYSFLMSTEVLANANLQDDEFADMDDIFFEIAERSRFARSPDYGAGLGGPLAAVSGPKKGGKPSPRRPGGITTPAPITAPSNSGRSSDGIPTIDQCKAIDIGGGTGSARGPFTRGSTKTNREFTVDKRENRVLTAIRDGADEPNDYLALSTVFCPNDQKCLDECKKEGCNYILSYHDRRKTNVTFLYNIDERILKDEAKYAKSDGYDSIVVLGKVVVKATTSGTRNMTNTVSSHRLNRRFGSIYDGCTQTQCCLNCIGPCFCGPFYCGFICTRGLAKLIIGLSVGLGVGLGVGVGVGAGVSGAAGRGLAGSRAAQAAARQQQAEQTEQFNQYQETYQKSYTSAQQQKEAQQSYQQNQQTMNKANSQQQKSDDAKQGSSKFADVSVQTFAAHYTGAMVDGPIQPIPFHPIPYVDFDPSPLGRLHWEAAAGSVVMPPVRYQGECGSCYAFTSADLVASQNAIERTRALKDVQTQQLSVQYLIDCGGTNASVGCKGGRPGALLKNLENSDGVPFESCYSYKEEAGVCNKNVADKCCQRHKVKFSQLVDISGPHEKEIFAKILNWGPVIAIIGANEQWMFYNGSGIIKARQCDPKLHNHAVIIAGYNYNETTTPTPYYIVRNSWGNDWGTNGHAKLEAGKNACGVAKYVLVACTGDCRNVTSVKDLIRRSNVPESYVQKYGVVVPRRGKGG